ncbi:WD40-repeat-containing domain protein [Lipomyces kononenkoae]|uniref:WD40-repeat-containing domain protein n=1 Tax=Lipomyces kononenkoae TaxID=34357 RepID=A0ACC3T8Z8_LIPKO
MPPKQPSTPGPMPTPSSASSTAGTFSAPGVPQPTGIPRPSNAQSYPRTPTTPGGLHAGIGGPSTVSAAAGGASVSGNVTPTTPGNVSAPPSSTQSTYTQADLNRIVLEYLLKKGYSKTEQMLRMESSNAMGGTPSPQSAINDSKTSNGTILKSTTDDPQLYIRAYASLRDWIETSLDLFKPELRKLLFPIFVHTFFYLIQKPDTNSPATSLARKFFDTYSGDHSILHYHDLQLLSGLTLPEHLQENETAKLYIQNKYRLNISRTTFDLLLHFLDENERNGGPVTIRLINQYIETNVTPSRPDRNDSRNQTLGDDEGIPGHITGRETNFNKQAVRLGKFPMDERMIKEVELRLKDEDNRSQQEHDEIGTVPGSKTLMQEFQELHKQEPEEDAPVRDVLPLPPFKGADVEAEIAAVKDARSRLKIGPAQASLPSVCMYTFHNTYDGLNCLEFSEDSTLVAGGFADSYVKVWSLKGEKLQGVIKGSTPTPSKRLVGHAGPVFGASFSPDNRYLLTCSDDKSARLWSMDTYSALVSYKGHNLPVWDVSFSPNGHYFATASHDQTARLWSCDHIYPLRIFAGHVSDVDCVTFHPNSTYVLTGSSDKSCRMWDVAKGTAVRVMLSHQAPVSCVCVSPDGRILASGADDGSIILWDLGTGKQIKTMRGHDRNTSVYSLSFSREGTVLVSAGADGSVRVWNVKGGSTTPSSVDGVVGGIAGTAAGTTASSGATDSDEMLANPMSNGIVAASSATAPGMSAAIQKQSASMIGRPTPVVATADQMAVFMTKKTPVYKIKFTRRNLCLAGGAFMGTS